MASPITITLPPDTLYPGSKFQAQININVTKPTKVRNITATFHGFERAKASYTTTNADGDSDQKTATEVVEIMKDDFLLFGSQRKGFFGRLGDSASTLVGGGDHELLKPGTYEYTVDLEIPESAPPSIKGNLASVQYDLKINVDIPVKIDWGKTVTLPVFPVPVDFSQSQPAQAIFPDESGRSIWQKTFGKAVTMNLAIDRDTLTAGTQALAMLTVESPEPVKVNKIEIRLAGIESTDVNGHRDSTPHTTPLGEIDSPNMIADRSVHEFDVVIPNSLVPHSQSGKNFSVSWKLEAQIHIPWASDPVIRVPVTLLPSATKT